MVRLVGGAPGPGPGAVGPPRCVIGRVATAVRHTTRRCSGRRRRRAGTLRTETRGQGARCRIIVHGVARAVVRFFLIARATAAPQAEDVYTVRPRTRERRMRVFVADARTDRRMRARRQVGTRAFCTSRVIDSLCGGCSGQSGAVHELLGTFGPGGNVRHRGGVRRGGRSDVVPEQVGEVLVVDPRRRIRGKRFDGASGHRASARRWRSPK